MARKPLCIDLFCGLGGWTEGFLAEGWDVIGFDIEQHVYGEHRYPAQLVLQDVRTLRGSQFKDADMIVASSPCQEFSYRAMPWKRAKALGPPLLGMELFGQAARIQREACAAAGRHIPLIQENVRGAQPWVGRARWHFGSYYLWGDVPALMPAARRARMKSNAGTPLGVKGPGRPRLITEELVIDENAGTKGYAARLGQSTISRRHGSKSKARKMASAQIAKIPAPLSRHIAHVFKPLSASAVAGGGTDG